MHLPARKASGAGPERRHKRVRPPAAPLLRPAPGCPQFRRRLWCCPPGRRLRWAILSSRADVKSCCRPSSGLSMESVAGGPVCTVWWACLHECVALVFCHGFRSYAPPHGGSPTLAAPHSPFLARPPWTGAVTEEAVPAGPGPLERASAITPQRPLRRRRAHGGYLSAPMAAAARAMRRPPRRPGCRREWRCRLAYTEPSPQPPPPPQMRLLWRGGYSSVPIPAPYLLPSQADCPLRRPPLLRTGRTDTLIQYGVGAVNIQAAVRARAMLARARIRR